MIAIVFNSNRIYKAVSFYFKTLYIKIFQLEAEKCKYQVGAKWATIN